MNYRVTHSTQYDYHGQVGLCWNRAILLPRETTDQKCLASELTIDPPPSDLRERTDFFGNRVHHFAIQQAHARLKVTAVSEVSVTPGPEKVSTASSRSWEEIKNRLKSGRNDGEFTALPYLYDSKQIRRTQELAEYANPSFSTDRPLVEAVSDLMQRIYTDFRYDPGVTTVATPLSEVLENRHGVCQDFAHLGIGCLRSLGLAARYVSGYIETVPPPGQAKMVGADASHAWFSVYAGDAGWIDFDPTNNKIPAGQHVTVAWGRDFADVSPLRGIALGGGKHKMSVAVDVARLSGQAA